MAEEWQGIRSAPSGSGNYVEGGVMDIQKEREAFEELIDIEIIISEGFKFNPNINQYYHPDHTNHRLSYAYLMGAWMVWQEKAQAVPEGFVLVPVKEIKEWYLDDSENIYREDPEWLCDIPVGEVVEVEHRVSYELDQDPVFAAIQWDEENSDVGYYETFKSKVEAEKVAAHCKAMVEAQEQGHD